MKLTRTWIDSNLNHKQRGTLVEWLLERSQNPTGELILEGLQENFPDFEDYPSVQSCITWKNKSWEFELTKREMHGDSELAKALARSGSFNDANAKLLESELFDAIRRVKKATRDGAEAVNYDEINTLALASSRLNRVSMMERKLSEDMKLMRIKLEKFEQDAAERAEKRRKLEEEAKCIERAEGITPATRKLIDELMGVM